MPLILKAAGERIYFRGKDGHPMTQIYMVDGWSFIKDRAERANLFSFECPEPCFTNGNRWIPTVRDEIYIYKSEDDFAADIRWFGGLLTETEDTTIQLTGSQFTTGYSIKAQAFDIILDKEIRQPQKSGLTWEELLKLLVSYHFSNQISNDYSFITNPAAAPPVRINNGSMRTLLRAMRNLTNYDYFVDAYKRLHVFLAADTYAGFDLDDTPLSGLTIWDERPTVTHEGRNLYNIVRQPFQAQVELNEWAGESFTAKGDPKGQGGQLPLLRTPSNIQESTFLDDKFDGDIFSDDWVETDSTATINVDYPNKGYLFPSLGQCQVLGGSGTLGSNALFTVDYYQFKESSYIIQEFQLTNMVGDGYIALFLDGNGLQTANFRAGLRVQNGALKALDGTVLVAVLDITVNYLIWVRQTATGWQYDIQGGTFATKQTLRTETITQHLTDYKLAAISNRDLKCSINSFRYRTSDRGVILEINGEHKTVGLEGADTDLPDIDAFLNVDETPALIKFRAASALGVIASVSSTTVFTVANGQGDDFKTGQRLLIGDNIIEEFNGREAYVASVSGNQITLVAPGLTGMTNGQQVLVGTTVPAKGDVISVRYAYLKPDEATAVNQVSIEKFGTYPLTLDEKDHIKRFEDAQSEAENALKRFENGITSIDFRSNSVLITTEPNTMTFVPVRLTKRPDPLDLSLTLQRVEITPKSGTHFNYSLHLESADPVKPLDDLIQDRNLVIGQGGVIRFSMQLIEKVVTETTISLRSVPSPYITWGNPEGRKWGEFKWKPPVVETHKAIMTENLLALLTEDDLVIVIEGSDNPPDPDPDPPVDPEEPPDPDPNPDPVVGLKGNLITENSKLILTENNKILKLEG